MNNQADPTLDALLTAVDTDRLLETTKTIAQWERLSGSDEERQAFDYIQSALENLGYQCVRYHPVCLVSLPTEASLQLVGDEIPFRCITHSFSVSTPSDGIELEVVYAGNGSADDYASVDARGKAVLIEGLATPNTVAPAEAAGAAAVIHNSGQQIHEMTISPVWGNPTPTTIPLLPTIPHLSVDQEGADRLLSAIDAGQARVRLSASVDTGWRPIPVLIADLTAETAHSAHVLLSGHVDSWYYGAMDNGSANAAMLECARLLASRRDALSRGLRLAFWSGHSHARYAASAWYADEFWSQINHFCVAHVNIDSPGGVGATDLSAASTMAESYPVAREIFAEVAGAELNYDRIGRLGDQSFWGAGVPSFYCSISQQPAQESPTGIGALLGRGGGLGWWWHTADDTMDKIDPAFLARDAKVLLATVYRLCKERILPYDQAGPAEEMLASLQALHQAGGDDLDLTESIAAARELRAAAQRLNELELDESASDDEIALYNGCVAGVSRILMPVNYTVSGEYEHDPALPAEPLPGLQPIRRLPGMRERPERYYPWLTKLRRERNRVDQAMHEARSLMEQTVAVFQMEP